MCPPTGKDVAGFVAGNRRAPVSRKGAAPAGHTPCGAPCWDGSPGPRLRATEPRPSPECFMEPTPQAIADCTRILEALLEQPHCLAELDIEARNRLMAAAGRLSRPDRTERRVQARAVHQHRKASRRAAD